MDPDDLQQRQAAIAHACVIHQRLLSRDHPCIIHQGQHWPLAGQTALYIQQTQLLAEKALFIEPSTSVLSLSEQLPITSSPHTPQAGTREREA